MSTLKLEFMCIQKRICRDYFTEIIVLCKAALHLQRPFFKVLVLFLASTTMDSCLNVFSQIFPMFSVVLTSELSEAEDCGFSEGGRQSGCVFAVISAASKYFLCDAKKRSCQC